MNNNVTPEMVKDFWAYMTTKYGTTVKSKADADEMKLVAMVLDAMHITDKDAFLARFVTTIGKTIYVPFTIGDDKNPVWSLFSQLAVCMHEHQHVIQANRDGEALFMVRYLLDPTWRATYEGEGYRTNMTLLYQMFGNQPDVDPYVRSIANYGLGLAEMAYFRHFLKMSIPAIVAGGVPDEACRVTLAWLATQNA